MKTYLTLAFYFFTGSCLIFCILLPLSSSSPLEKGEATITWQIGAQDTVPVKRILKRQTFVFDKDDAKSKQEDVALASVFAAAQGSGDVPTITTNGGSDSTEQTSSTASDQTPTTAVTKDMSTTETSAPTTVNSTTTESAGTENVTTELPYTTNTENTTTSAGTTISTENGTTSEAMATTVSTEKITTSAATTVSTENITTSAATTVSTENSTTLATTTVSTENSTTSTTTTISTENITTLPVTTSNENNTTSSIATRTSTTEAMATSSSVMTTTTKPEIANLEWIVVGSVSGGVLLIIICAVVGVVICCKCCKKEIGPGPDDEMIDLSEDEVVLQRDQYFEDVNVFLNQHTEYVIINESLKQRELGSRMQKRWYSEVCEREDHEKKKLLTVGPQSQGCPLKLHKEKHLKGLKKLLAELKKHPYLHPIEQVEVYVHKDEQLKETHLLLMVQPFVPSGSLKDMIYKTRPLKSWANKYSQRSNGIPTEKVASYGRQILEAMKFLYSQGFPKCVLGHVQTGNIFVVNDVCQLGGYENTLLGYKTRLFRLCKDDLQHFDIILFGHVIFEMAAGYELTQKQPSEEDYTAVDMDVRSVLEYIFEEGFPHDITEISNHKFFCDNVSVTELKDFPPSDYELKDSMITVLKKVCKKSGLPAEGDGHRGVFSGWTLPKWRNPFKQGRRSDSDTPNDEPKQDAIKKIRKNRQRLKKERESRKLNVDERSLIETEYTQIN